MYTKPSIMFCYTETSLHIGSGTSLSAVDLPVQREKYTNFPNGAGSGIKGAVRDWFENFEKDNSGNWKNGGKENVDAVFGKEEEGSDHAGAVSFSDLRLLLFPVRSMKGVFAYLTCPYVISRLKRELIQIGVPVDWQIDLPGENQVFGTSNNLDMNTKKSDLVINDKVVLEEFAFLFQENENLNAIANWLSINSISNSPDYDFWNKKVRRSLLLISDDNFKDFVEHSTEIQARIKLGEGKSSDTKKGGNLFYEENVPGDSLFYSLALASKPFLTIPLVSLDSDEKVLKYLKSLDSKHLQLGGDETIGKGVVNIKFLG